jgi:hypothetical protein
MANQLDPTAFQLSLSALRPDLSWVEALLGERLVKRPNDPNDFHPRPKALDHDVIPPGEYCYYPTQYGMPGIVGYQPCPHFHYTDYGTVRCDYMPLETNDCSRPVDEVIQHLGGEESAAQLGFKAHSLLEDSYKECGVHLDFPSDLEALNRCLGDYQSALQGQRVVDHFGLTDYMVVAKYRGTKDMRLLTIAKDRWDIWDCLCNMIEPVPREAIDRLMRLDAQYRERTDASDDIVHCTLEEELMGYPNPNHQFWYLFRKNLRWDGTAFAKHSLR